MTEYKQHKRHHHRPQRQGTPRARLVILLLLSGMLMLAPAVWFPMDFDSDQGIEYSRDFEISWHYVRVIQHANDSDYWYQTEQCNILPMRGMAAGIGLLCLGLAFWRKTEYSAMPLQITFALMLMYCAVFAGYAMHISSDMVATIRLQWSAIPPIVAAILLGYITRHLGMQLDQEEDEDYADQEYPDLKIVK